MESRILSRRDIAFLLHEWLDVSALTSRARFADHSRETFDAALDTCERLATDHFAPINRLLDTDEPLFDGETVKTPDPLKTALRAFSDAGLMAAGLDYEFGGMQLPFVVERACFCWFNAASIGAAAYALLTIANANLLLAHGTEAQIESWVRPMASGRYFGTMCLSEPQAGSSLSDIRTRAERQTDGSFRIFGNKMWISGGDQDISDNIVHLVLAKIPDADGRLAPGVKGISLFLVPKVLLRPDGATGPRNDVSVAGLNHKMGYRGTVNTLLNFGEGRHKPYGAAGAVGYLVGQERQGLACMFHMMNDARIGVGLGAVALGYTAYLHALDYARNRPQGRSPKGKDPASPQVPLIEHADVRRMLLAAKSYVEGGLAMNLYCARLVDEQNTAPDAESRRRAHLLLELLTPVAKSWPSQWCQEANSLAIQVHGGYGYTRDYPVEQFYRDQRLNPIHEGTHGIQAIDLLGRKVRMEGGSALDIFTEECAKTIAAATVIGGEWADAGARLARVGARLVALVERLHSVGDPEVTLANASAFLEAFGHHVIAWTWLSVALRAREAMTGKAATAFPEETAFYQGKIQAARYFLRWELPKVDPIIDALHGLDTTALEMQNAWF